MRPTASHRRPHSYVDSCAALSPRGGGMSASARQRPCSCKQEQRTPRLPKPVTRSPSCDGKLATAALASGSFPARASRSEEQAARQVGGGGRNARATSRARARFLERPPATCFRLSPAPLALPQSSGELRNSHVSLNPLSARLLRLATQKPRPLVQKLWTTSLPCGSPRKT
jgi:hypothetical protein